MRDEHGLLSASYEVRRQRPTDEVWAFLTELPNTGRWRQRMEVSCIYPGPTLTVTSSYGAWRRMAMVGEVIARKPPHRFAYRIVEGPLRARNAYVLKRDGYGTRFTMSGAAGMGRLTLLLVPIIRRAYGRTMRRELRRLQQLLS